MAAPAATAEDPPLFQSTIRSLPLLARGKVRENYAVGSDRMLMVASDRLSAFDVVMGEPIPGKGRVLTQMALFWFGQLDHVVPNHLTGDDPESVVAAHSWQSQPVYFFMNVRPSRQSPMASGKSGRQTFVAAARAMP